MTGPFLSVQEHAAAEVRDRWFIDADEALVEAYALVTRPQRSELASLYQRAATHIEAAYHLLTVAEVVNRTAPSNIIDFPTDPTPPPRSAA